jgi:hypothetical protein
VCWMGYLGLYNKPRAEVHKIRGIYSDGP